MYCFSEDMKSVVLLVFWDVLETHALIQVEKKHMSGFDVVEVQILGRTSALKVTSFNHKGNRAARRM